MNTLRRISAVTALSLTLAVTAFAGHIETPGAPAPAPATAPAPIPTTTTSAGAYIVLTILTLIGR